MTFLVLLGHPEVDLEHQETVSAVRVGIFTVDQLLQPFGMDQLVVPGKTLDGEAGIGRPVTEALVVARYIHVTEVRELVA